MIRRAIRHDAPDIPGVIDVLHLILHRLGALGNRTHIVQQRIATADPVGDIVNRPTDVGGNQIEQAPRRRREAADQTLGIEEQRRELGTGQQIAQIVVGLLELVELLLQLGIHGREFFVERLQLFLRGFQFLVGRLQFLIHAHGLLMGGLELLVRGFQFLDRPLQLFAGGFELVFQLGNHALIFAANGDVRTLVALGHGGRLKADQEQIFGDPRVIQRARAHPYLRHRTAGHAGHDRHRAVIHTGLANDLPQFHAQPPPRQLQQIIAGRAVGQLQIIACGTEQLNNLMVVGDHDRRRHKTLQQHTLNVRPQQLGAHRRVDRFQVQFGRIAGRHRPRRETLPFEQRCALHALEDPSTLVQRTKQLVCATDGF